MCRDWLLCWRSAMKKFVAHTCEVPNNCTRLLSRALAARVVCTRGEGADWQTDLYKYYNCSLILSQAVGFTVFPHSHVHSPARDLNGSTPLVCGWDLGSSSVLSPYVYDLHFQALWSSDSENYISSVKLIEMLRERVCLVCVLDKLILLSKFVTEIERIYYTYTAAK